MRRPDQNPQPIRNLWGCHSSIHDCVAWLLYEHKIIWCYHGEWFDKDTSRYTSIYSVYRVYIMRSCYGCLIRKVQKSDILWVWGQNRGRSYERTLGWIWKCAPDSRFNMRTTLSGIGIPIIKIRQSYLYDWNSYTGKTASLYWDGPWLLC